ncbi:unnamed protein product [Lampetra planeri]
MSRPSRRKFPRGETQAEDTLGAQDEHCPETDPPSRDSSPGSSTESKAAVQLTWAPSSTNPAGQTHRRSRPSSRDRRMDQLLNAVSVLLRRLGPDGRQLRGPQAASPPQQDGRSLVQPRTPNPGHRSSQQWTNHHRHCGQCVPHGTMEQALSHIPWPCRQQQKESGRIRVTVKGSWPGKGQ